MTRFTVAIAWGLSVGVVCAGTFNWTGAVDGYWTNANNWAEGVVPGRCLVPDGAGGFTTNGVKDSIAIFGDQLSGAAVTTIDFDGVYSVSNLLTSGSHAYTYGTKEDQFIPIQIFGTFSAAETPATPVATLVGCLQTGVERTDYNAVKNEALWGGETVTIRNNSALGKLDASRWGWSTKSPDYATFPKHGGEMGIRVEGSGDILLGPTGQGGQSNPQFVHAMSGLLQLQGTFQARTLSCSGDVLHQIEVLEDSVLRPVNYWYQWFSSGYPVRIFGAGECWASAVGYNANNATKWKCVSIVVNAPLTIECRVPATKYYYAPTTANGGLDFPWAFSPTGSSLISFTGSVDVGPNEYFTSLWCNLNAATADSTCGMALARIGRRGTCGSHGDADFVLGGKNRLRYTGSGETMDRILAIGKNGSSSAIGILEHAGTGTLRVESCVSNFLDGVTGTLELLNSTTNTAIFAGEALADVKVKGGTWTLAAEAEIKGTLLVEGVAENPTCLKFETSTSLDKLYDTSAAKSAVATIQVAEGQSLTIADFKVSNGAKVNFFVEAGGQVTATSQTVDAASGATVTLNGHAALFNAAGVLVSDYTSDENYWLEAVDGNWSTATKWSRGALPSTAFPTFIDIMGGDYTVTLSEPVEVGTLSVGNAGTGTATLAIDGAQGPAGLSLANPLTVSAGGRIVSGGAQVTNVVSSYSTSALLRLSGGSELLVTGGVFRVEDWGNGASPLGAGNSSISLTEGSTLKAEGDAAVILRGAPGNTATYFSIRDGSYLLSGNAVHRDQALYGCKYNESLGPKNSTNDCKAAGSSVYYHKVSHNAGKTARWEFTGNAHIDATSTPWSLEVGAEGYEGYSLFRANTDWTGTFYLWNLISVGVNKGMGEMLLEKGNFRSGIYRFGIGLPALSETTISKIAASVTGRVVVAENATLYYGGSYGLLDKSTAGYVGMNIGYALNLGNDTSRCYGELEVEGQFQNREGYLMVGAGPSAVGRIVQRKGSFESQYINTFKNGVNITDMPASIGLFGGQGSYEMSGGTFKTYRSLYVGGITTNLLRRPHANGAYFMQFHNAQGTLDISGGQFWVTNSIILGLDGTGTLRLSGTGEVKAHSIVVSNTVGQAASTLCFTADAQRRCGRIDPATQLSFAPGSRVVVDVSACAANPRTFTVWELDLAPEGLANATLELVGNESVHAPNTLEFSADGRNLVWKVQRGTFIYVR